MIRSSNSTTSSRSSLFIAVALTIAMLYFGRLIFIPLALALVFSFLLTPFVSLLERCHLGRAPATLAVLGLCFVLSAGLGWEVVSQMLEITGQYKTNLEETIRSLHPPKDGALGQATATVRELNEELAQPRGRSQCMPPMNRRRRAPPSPFPFRWPHLHRIYSRASGLFSARSPDHWRHPESS